MFVPVHLSIITPSNLVERTTSSVRSPRVRVVGRGDIKMHHGGFVVVDGYMVVLGPDDKTGEGWLVVIVSDCWLLISEAIVESSMMITSKVRGPIFVPWDTQHEISKRVEVDSFNQTVCVLVRVSVHVCVSIPTLQ